jgi:hypothetical protein
MASYPLTLPSGRATTFQFYYEPGSTQPTVRFNNQDFPEVCQMFVAPTNLDNLNRDLGRAYQQETFWTFGGQPIPDQQALDWAKNATNPLTMNEGLEPGRVIIPHASRLHDRDRSILPNSASLGARIATVIGCEPPVSDELGAPSRRCVLESV